VPPRPAIEEDALRALSREHAAALLAYAFRLTGDRGRSEDIVQETLLRAWRRTPALDGRGSIRAWLFTVARNIAVDGFRTRGARPFEIGEDAVAELPAKDEIEQAIDHWLILDAISTLLPQHREVIVETYYLGRSVAEAAEVLAIPAGTVKSRTFYALRALRLALEERGWTA
jgi:RNA polymerase sigma-70 factor, ECF subfamily